MAIKKNSESIWTPPIVKNRPEGVKPNFDDTMERMNEMRRRMFGGLWGAVIGDALGVPVEFKSRDEVRRDPVTGMRGYGTFHLPAGSWSDDSSLLLCTADSLARGYDLKDIADRFMKWMTGGLWTPYGSAFDIGNATAHAIKRLQRGISPELSGGDTERDNGNGSLMRIIPVAVCFYTFGIDEFIQRIHAISSITHRHPRSLMACGIYCLIARNLIEGKTAMDAYREAIDLASDIYDRDPFRQELRHFRRILGGKIGSLPEEAINSSGYVIDTLEASLWCLLNTESYSEAVLRAVNLGHDTDTTGCVTGGLAGICYGIQGIPEEWINVIVRRDDIAGLFDMLITSNNI